MYVNNTHYRTIWPSTSGRTVFIIDQTKLPFHFEVVEVESVEKMIHAISTMQVRGAPLIGASAAYGVALAMLQDTSDVYLSLSAEQLIQSRPTAVNLAWAVNRMVIYLTTIAPTERLSAAWQEAARIADEDVEQNKLIGRHGFKLIQQAYQKETFHILTHCNAGWLATVDFGTALSPIYTAHDAGLDIHVWVDETRPRNQGASLTAWELAQHGVPYTIISDNAGGHLMQQGQVDMVMAGADRVAANGDVCNKIGTYLKALAAHDNQIPFYAAVPSPTIDSDLAHGGDIVIEERHHDEVAYMQGQSESGRLQTVRVIPKESKVANPAFDVTPARLVTGIITDKGVFAPNKLT
ncbi:MAG: S-methyl-5-thioribose-1-phosphate isomerase [Methylophilaceae bacterium]